ncbi:hypothetical protein RFI_17785 [Reticulomyxa filosa]|uniref:Uncharacterized protein n=1 Tax=Reticulomyxa filosa TaxID=46433 RepID=X6N162_RETFI|nr:hypothetical protein RFI_17785 [Reticulomyxa filosa]|eukprot:ETO19449.1 hypothetical protein RFI_17785 [Reticulomyxa filosa]
MGTACSPGTDNQTQETNMERPATKSDGGEDETGMLAVTPEQLKAMTDQIIELSGRTAHLEQQLEEEKVRYLKLEERHSQLETDLSSDRTVEKNASEVVYFNNQICQGLGSLFKTFLTAEERNSEFSEDELSTVIISDLLIDKFNLKGICIFFVCCLYYL